MTTPFDLDRIGGQRALAALVDEVCSAGEEALSLFRRGLRVELKGDRSPVTEADRRVEERLRAFLASRFPDHGFLGEETGASSQPGAFRWIVDPIDGTRAFTRGLPSWSVLVGLEHEGEPVVGVALLPALGNLFVGVRGAGATRDGRPLRVSSVGQLGQALVMHGGLEQFEARGLWGPLSELGRRAYSARGFGDMMGHAALLEGKADAVVDPGVKPWDLCAAAVLVREAGGRLTDFGGADTVHGGDGLASNGCIHEELLALLRPAG